MMDIENKVIIVTGASQGIGFEASKKLSSLGAKVVLAARSANAIKELESELENSFAVVTDMRKPEDIKNLIKETKEKYGRIDILINNAGQGMYSPLENMDMKDYRSIVELNLFSVVEAMQLVIPIMRGQKGGMILNISSGVTKRYIPLMSGYSSTKYALNAISFISRQELEKDGIVVSVLSPKITESNFAKNSVGSRPDFSASGRPMPEIDSAEFVADKIVEIIKSEEREVQL